MLEYVLIQHILKQCLLSHLVHMSHSNTEQVHSTVYISFLEVHSADNFDFFGKLWNQHFFCYFLSCIMQYAHLHIKVYLQIVSVLLGVQCHINGIGRIFLFCLFTLKLWCSSDLLSLTYEVVVSKPTFLSGFAFWDFDSSYIYLHFNRYVSVLQTCCDDLWFPVMKSLIGWVFPYTVYW